MFQYLVSGLATGATLVLYEGSPLKDPSILWRMVDDYGITILGTSAKWIEQISKHYSDVGEKHSLSSLKQILSTGSPLPPQLFDFVYQHVKKDVLLGSVTGGTDICSVFAGGRWRGSRRGFVGFGWCLGRRLGWGKTCRGRGRKGGLSWGQWCFEWDERECRG